MATYCNINDSTNICLNSILWDGVEAWTEPVDTFTEIIADVNIGDEVEFVNDAWQKVIV